LFALGFGFVEHLFDTLIRNSPLCLPQNHHVSSFWGRRTI
jgi:hypothetical protein